MFWKNISKMFPSLSSSDFLSPPLVTLPPNPAHPWMLLRSHALLGEVTASGRRPSCVVSVDHTMPSPTPASRSCCCCEGCGCAASYCRGGEMILMVWASTWDVALAGEALMSLQRGTSTARPWPWTRYCPSSPASSLLWTACTSSVYSCRTTVRIYARHNFLL